MRPDELPQPGGIRHRYVQAGDVRLHVAEAGEGEPLLLLHGWPQHWWCWRGLIEPLSRRYRVLAPDLRGWGWSDAPPGAYRKPTFAQDIVALLDAEGIERARVLGHDWGGWTTFLLALDHPERIVRAAALDITPPWPSRPQRGLLGLPAFISYQVTVGTPVLGPRTMTSGNAFIRAIIRGASARGARWDEAELDAYADVLRQPARARASSACYRTFLTRELPASLRHPRRAGELKLPMLLLMGGESILQRTFSPQSSPNLEVREIPGAGHFLPEEAPRDVLRHVEPFLAG
jgi:pimeloyl-ACP methyl ester carboxylesterase